MVPFALGEYRFLGQDQLGDDVCDVVESRVRLERLWVGRETGLIMAYMSFRSAGLGLPDPVNFYKNPIVKVLTEHEFQSEEEWKSWKKNSLGALSDEKRLSLILAIASYYDIPELKPVIMVRFSDYREIAKNVWWPFCEDVVAVSTAFRHRFQTVELATDRDLTDIVAVLKP